MVKSAALTYDETKFICRNEMRFCGTSAKRGGKGAASLAALFHTTRSVSLQRSSVSEMRLFDANLVSESCCTPGDIAPHRFIIFLVGDDDFIAPDGKSRLNIA
jgi:hypothetical protein